LFAQVWNLRSESRPTSLRSDERRLMNDYCVDAQLERVTGIPRGALPARMCRSHRPKGDREPVPVENYPGLVAEETGTGALPVPVSPDSSPNDAIAKRDA
jgi:hypothetical protein